MTPRFRAAAIFLLVLFAGAAPGFAAEASKALSCAGFGAPSGPAVRQLAQNVRAGDPYYVEFRQRSSRTVLPGHLYVMFGRLGRDGEPVTRHFTSLEPGNTGNGPFDKGGHGVEPSIRDCTRPARLALRVSLSAKRYARLLARIRAAEAAPPHWRLASYNCHDYAADLAASVGLKSGGFTMVPSALYMRAFIAANGG